MFLDYVQIKGLTSNDDYSQLLKRVGSSFDNAEQELIGGKAGTGIDEVILLVEDLGEVCLNQARNLYRDR